MNTVQSLVNLTRLVGMKPESTAPETDALTLRPGASPENFGGGDAVLN